MNGLPEINVSRRRFLQAAGTGIGFFVAGAPHRSRGLLLGDEQQQSLKVLTADPLNAETPFDPLVREWITPNPLFYIRNHAPIPSIDAESFRLRVEGLVEEPLSLSLAELQERFPKASTVATMTCAGNRREEFEPLADGVQWGPGAIGNAEWAGVRLADVLKKVRLKEGAKHVWFDGLDRIEKSGEPFGASIPLDKARAASAGATLLATSMNGEPLSPEHGFPLRTVVPGYIGARSVKWLGKITVSDKPSSNHYVAEAYKLIPKDSEKDVSEVEPIYTWPINSAVGIAGNGKSLQLQGYALAPGVPGRTIARVEVSADGGRNWSQAKLTTEAREYTWRLWEATVQPANANAVIIARAIDSTGETQPEKAVWNAKGYLYNAWSRIERPA